MCKSNEEYLKSYSHCPCCNSDQIEGQPFDPYDNKICQEVACLGCNAEWTDTYQLESYALVRQGE